MYGNAKSTKTCFVYFMCHIIIELENRYLDDIFVMILDIYRNKLFHFMSYKFILYM